MAIEVLESAIINKQAVFDRALEITAQRYGIDLTSTEESLGSIEMMFSYKGGKVSKGEHLVAQNKELKEQLNASLFQFGVSNTPTGERTRPTVDEIQPGIRGTGISFGEGVALADEVMPFELVPDNNEDNIEFKYDEIKKQETQKLETHNDGIPRMIKDEHGFPVLMNREKAIEYCKNQGAHLASARELAQIAMSHGAKGIVEIAGDKPNGNYQLVEATDRDGISDSFYFSVDRYNAYNADPSTGSIYYMRIWTSSNNSRNPKQPLHLLVQIGGFQSNFGADQKLAVICMPGE